MQLELKPRELHTQAHHVLCAGLHKRFTPVRLGGNFSFGLLKKSKALCERSTGLKLQAA